MADNAHPPAMPFCLDDDDLPFACPLPPVPENGPLEVAAPPPEPEPEPPKKKPKKEKKTPPPPPLDLGNCANAYELLKGTKEDEMVEAAGGWTRPPLNQKGVEKALELWGLSKDHSLYEAVVSYYLGGESKTESQPERIAVPKSPEPAPGNGVVKKEKTTASQLPVQSKPKHSNGHGSKKSKKEELVGSKTNGKSFPIAEHRNALSPTEHVQKATCRELVLLGQKLCANCSLFSEEAPTCLFIGIRRLSVKPTGEVFVSGFMRAEDLVSEETLSRALYLPRSGTPGRLGWSHAQARYVLQNLYKPFRDLYKSETRFIRHLRKNHPEKLATMGVYRGGVDGDGEVHRELCDSCMTTVFNVHLFCADCAIVACPACVKDRVQNEKRDSIKKRDKRDEFGWPLCYDYYTKEEKEHSIKDMILGQLLPDPFPSFCSTIGSLDRQVKELMDREKISDGCVCDKKSATNHCFCSKNTSPTSVSPPTVKDEPGAKDMETTMKAETTMKTETSVTEKSSVWLGEDDGRGWTKARQPPPSGTAKAAKSVALRSYDDLLYLHGTRLSEAAALPHFQERWRRGLPILVRFIHELVEWPRWNNMWSPETLKKAQKSVASSSARGQIIDCSRNNPVSVKSADFWRGYSDYEERPTLPTKPDERLVLKFKDYPAAQTFKEALQPQFHAFCSVIPIPSYSAPQGLGDGASSHDLLAMAKAQDNRGAFNLVRALPPQLYIIPDLGPKMYTAYGMLSEKRKGTTNLHLDISDAVNVLVDVTVPAGASKEWHKREMRSHLDAEGFEGDELEELMGDWETAGALWTIWRQDDSDKLAEWIKKEKKTAAELEKATSKAVNFMEHPIHDQNFYLTRKLRDKLYEDTGIRGFTFVQRLGEAVFIPAGAAHQVQNLLSCTKVAEDFVTPEGVANCARITDQFRYLSLAHANHEDKLQLSNILFHAVKEAVAALNAPDLGEKECKEDIGVTSGSNGVSVTL